MKFFKKNKIYFIITGILILGLVFLNVLPGVSGFAKNTLFKVLSPIQRAFIKAGNKTIDFFEIILTIRELNKENIELKKKNLELESEISLFKETEEENKALRQALKFPEKELPIYDIAEVVGKEIQGEDDWILINKGKNNGVDINSPIVSEELALVGKVIQVDDNFSKVMLISHSQSTVAIKIENRKMEGLLQKEKGSNLIFIDFVPKEENIQLKERIVTSGMDKIYLPGIYIGTVEKIDASQNQLFQKIIVQPAVNFEKLERVFILKANK